MFQIDVPNVFQKIEGVFGTTFARPAPPGVYCVQFYPVSDPQ